MKNATNQLNPYQSWLETNKQEIISTLEIACLNWLNEQIQQAEHDPINSIQQTGQNKFEKIPLKGNKSKSKCGYAFDKKDDFFFVITFNYYPNGKKSFNTGETLKNLWNKGKPDLNAKPIKSSSQPIVKPVDAAKVANDQAAAKKALESDLKLFDSLPTTGTSEYLQKKGLLEYEGADIRYGKDKHGNFIALLIQDINGKRRGIQKIYDNGSKIFTTKMKKEGCFILIDGNPNVINICEGFATGLSLRLANGSTIFCALDANNLKSVALALKLWLETKAIKPIVTITADNDFRLPTDKNQQNTGIIKAKEAAIETGFQLTYPTLDNVKCDFNDIHIKQGLDSVLQILSINRIDDLNEIKNLDVAKLPFAMIEEAIKKNKCRQIIKGNDLMKKAFKEVEFIVDSLIPESSLNLLAAPPKVGKSWLAMDLALGVALGGKALGRLDCTKQNVLYLSLDSSNEQKLQSRLKILETSNKVNIPDNLCFLTSFSQGKEAITELLEIIKEHNFKFVIIDILHNLKDLNSTKNKSVYDSDYNFIRDFRTITEETGCAILFVHHTNKGKHDDVLNQISGSNGLVGSVDNTFILNRARSSDEGELVGIGRDLLHDDPIYLKWHKEDCIWSIIDNKSEPLTVLQQTVLNAVMMDLKNTKAISEYIERSESQTRNILSVLTQRGYIKSVKRGEYKCSN